MTFPPNPFRAAAPVPAPSHGEKIAKVSSPWLTVKVGESWLIPDYSDIGPYRAAMQHGIRAQKKFSRQREGNGLRITRVA